MCYQNSKNHCRRYIYKARTAGTKRRDQGQCARGRIFGGGNASQGSVGGRRAAGGHGEERGEGVFWARGRRSGGAGGGVCGRWWGRAEGARGVAPTVGL